MENDIDILPSFPIPDFLDYYFSSLSYLAARKERRGAFDADTSVRKLTPLQQEKELKSYLGRERVLLRKRRAKLRVDQFHIITQVGQGGYGEVFLARKQDSGEVCALKRMKKGTLIKMDEARHVLVERDILTATKSPWLVRLLYAFQDPEYVSIDLLYRARFHTDSNGNSRCMYRALNFIHMGSADRFVAISPWNMFLEETLEHFSTTLEC
jgi:serine/threonine protein kinase